jgi:hypothetical protein
MIFWLWFEIVIIFTNTTQNLWGMKTLLKNHIYSKIKKQKTKKLKN